MAMDDQKTPLVVLEDVERTFMMGEVAVPVLRGVTCAIPRHRLTVILGPSGSGKTTMLNLVGGIDRPTAGAVTFDGSDLTSLDDRALTRFRRDSVGFVFQFYNVIATLTALENVQVGAELVQQPMDAVQALELVELGDRMTHFPAQLSGGEQQRVAIARALVKNPPLMLCDEPTGALDLDTGRSVLAMLRRITDEMDKTVVVVTHNSAIAAAADRIIRMGSGVIESIDDNPHPTPPLEVVW
jgi:putative ABC transport system ATP-binding protein